MLFSSFYYDDGQVVSGFLILEFGQQKKPSIPWKGTRATRVATLIDLFITNKSTCLITAFQPATTYSTSVAQLKDGFTSVFTSFHHPLALYKKTFLVTTSHHRFICEIIHTLLHDVNFRKSSFIKLEN